jgi:hypothetical protein
MFTTFADKRTATKAPNTPPIRGNVAPVRVRNLWERPLVLSNSLSRSRRLTTLPSIPAAGFAIDEVVADNGVSGVATRLIERLEGRRLRMRVSC